MTLRNKADNKKAIDANKDKLHKLQKEALDNNPGLKVYKDAHFTFRFVYYSAEESEGSLLDDVFKYSKKGTDVPRDLINTLSKNNKGRITPLHGNT